MGRFFLHCKISCRNTSKRNRRSSSVCSVLKVRLKTLQSLCWCLGGMMWSRKLPCQPIASRSARLQEGLTTKITSRTLWVLHFLVRWIKLLVNSLQRPQLWFGRRGAVCLKTQNGHISTTFEIPLAMWCLLNVYDSFFLHVCCLPGSGPGRWVHTKDPAGEAEVLPDGMCCDQAIAVGEALMIILILDHVTPLMEIWGTTAIMLCFLQFLLSIRGTVKQIISKSSRCFHLKKFKACFHVSSLVGLRAAVAYTSGGQFTLPTPWCQSMTIFTCWQFSKSCIKKWELSTVSDFTQWRFYGRNVVFLED